MSLKKSIKVNCFIKKTKLLKSGEAPIFIRIIIGKERDEFGIKMSVMPKYWNNEDQEVKSNCKKAIEVNPLLNDYRNRIHTYFNVMRMDKQKITPRIIKERIIGKKEKKRTILQIFKEHNVNARKLINIDFAEDTVKRYETTCMHTQNFIKWQYNREDIPLEELNQYFIDQFELYLKTERNCAHNTAIKYLKNFKKIVRIALANNWMENDPFANIRFKLKPVEPVFLSNNELMRIINKSIAIKRIEQVRDAFVFCCFTGCFFRYENA